GSVLLADPARELSRGDVCVARRVQLYDVAADGADVLSTPVARIVILGASNVARGIATIADVARETFGSPVEVLAAMGHGRSHGCTPSIPLSPVRASRESGVCQAMKTRPPLPTWTILTDIGNDLIYGCQPEQVTQWIDDCAGRLRGRSESMLLTGLPLASVQR